jgi:hypothetical protein
MRGIIITEMSVKQIMVKLRQDNKVKIDELEIGWRPRAEGLTIWSNRLVIW